MTAQRNTVQRTLVSNAVRSLANHPTPDEVYEYIHEKHPNVSRSTVYRNLNLLCASGALLKVPIPDAADRVDHNITPHCHAICSVCGRVCDVDMADGGDIRDKVADSHGFCIDDSIIVFSGRCADCIINPII